MDQTIREHLSELLLAENSHVTFEAAVEGMPPHLRGKRPNGAIHSAWEVLEHIRLGQWDYLEMARNPGHVRPRFPEGYWPAQPSPPTPDAWNSSVASFQADREAMLAVVRDPATDLAVRIPIEDNRTVMRCVLLAADHTAYHLGELVMLRRLLRVWERTRGVD
jgi:hypothetical protein